MLIVLVARRRLARDGWITIPPSVRDQLGLGRDRLGRAAKALEAAGLVEIKIEPGKARRYRLLVRFGRN